MSIHPDHAYGGPTATVHRPGTFLVGVVEFLGRGSGLGVAADEVGDGATQPTLAGDRR